METENFVSTLREDGVLIIKINRPKKLNAITFEMFTELKEHIEKVFSSGRDIRVIVLTHVGKHFTSGLDLNSAMQIN